jgi:hypothetical protein
VRLLLHPSPPLHALGPAHSTQQLPEEAVQLRCPAQEYCPVQVVLQLVALQVMGEEHEWLPEHTSSQSVPLHETGVWQL